MDSANDLHLQHPQSVPGHHPPNTHRRLVKKNPPPSAGYNNYIDNSQSGLRRAPSAPTYPRLYHTTPTTAHHQRSPTSPSPAAFPPSSSSNSSLDKQQPDHYHAYAVSPSPHQIGVSPAAAAAAHAVTASSDPRYSPPSRQSLVDRYSGEVIGAPIDAFPQYSQHQPVQQPIYEHFESVHPQPAASHKPQQHPPPPRPNQLQHAYTADARLTTPRLRQSASFAAFGKKMDTATPPRSDTSGTQSPRQRYSDDADSTGKGSRKSDGGKKKSGFSSFMSGMLSSPRRPTISNPSNPMHVTHVSIDNETGEYTVCSVVRSTRCGG